MLIANAIHYFNLTLKAEEKEKNLFYIISPNAEELL